MCGIVGIVGTPQASREVHQALLMLQHRGQDSAGILSVDSESGKFHIHRAMGQVAQGFDAKDMDRLQGIAAIGHTRYSTIGEIKEADLQPMAISLPVGIGMVHNGNVSNYFSLRRELIAQNRLFMSDNDLEIILHMTAEGFAQAPHTDPFQKLSSAIHKVMTKVEGGFSVVGLLGSNGMFAFRDSHGIRPLVLGKRVEKREGAPSAQDQVSYCVTSETAALKFLGYEFIRDVLPGELVWMTSDGKIQSKVLSGKLPLPCMFEWVYFSSADSTLESRNVYQVRLALGHLLGKRIKAHPSLPKFDVIAPVPDTSRPAAIGLAEILGTSFREVLIKNRYVQRSFIMNGQDRRRLAVGMKFSVVDELVKGKSVLLVDDSIVRGTTSKKLIDLLKHRGAAKVYLASTCPPIVHPCYYGIDFPTPQELVAHGRNEEEIAKELGADGVYYSTMQDLTDALEGTTFCRACLNGEYAYPPGGTRP